jgi:CubicO group peptidase (beta-lactamase class C family)
LSGDPMKGHTRHMHLRRPLATVSALALVTFANIHAEERTATLPLSVPEAVGMSPERLDRLKPYFQKYVDEGKLSGVVSLVARKGKIVHFENFGKRDVEADKAMEKDSLVRIYSMTKPILRVALMMLHEEGKFLLKDKLSKHIPEFADLTVLEDGEEVTPTHALTVQRLLTHTGGFTYGFFGNTEVDQRYREAKVLREKNLQEMIQHLGEIPLQDHPGEKWHYSVSVDIQGHLVEVLSGMPLDKFLQERIFKPLGMSDTFFEVPADKLDRFAANYRFSKSETMKLTDGPADSKFGKEVTFFSGGGGLVSTAEDYWRFCQMLLNKGEFQGQRLLGRKSVELMTLDHLPAVLEEHEPTSSFGFGLGVQVITDVAASGSPGSVGTYSWGGAAGTIFWIDPEEELTAMVMIQLMNSPYELRSEVKSLVYSAIID